LEVSGRNHEVEDIERPGKGDERCDGTPAGGMDVALIVIRVAVSGHGSVGILEVFGQVPAGFSLTSAESFV